MALYIYMNRGSGSLAGGKLGEISLGVIPKTRSRDGLAGYLPFDRTPSRLDDWRIVSGLHRVQLHSRIKEIREKRRKRQSRTAKDHVHSITA